MRRRKTLKLSKIERNGSLRTSDDGGVASRLKRKESCVGFGAVFETVFMFCGFRKKQKTQYVLRKSLKLSIKKLIEKTFENAIFSAKTVFSQKKIFKKVLTEASFEFIITI